MNSTNNGAQKITQIFYFEKCIQNLIDLTPFEGFKILFPVVLHVFLQEQLMFTGNLRLYIVCFRLDDFIANNIANNIG